MYRALCSHADASVCGVVMISCHVVYYYYVCANSRDACPCRAFFLNACLITHVHGSSAPRARASWVPRGCLFVYSRRREGTERARDGVERVGVALGGGYRVRGEVAGFQARGAKGVARRFGRAAG